MSLFKKLLGGGSGDGALGSGDELSLAEAWQLLAPRLGATLEVRGDRSVQATGVLRGRGWSADVVGKGLGNAALYSMRGAGSIRNKSYDEWTCQFAVSCTNPRALSGVMRSFVDPNDPSWTPGVYNPAAGRSVVSNPPSLAATVLTASLHARLMALTDDVDIIIEPAAVRVFHVDKTLAGRGSFIGGCLLHHPPTSGIPMPERAIAGVPWWLELLCDIADAVDAA